MRRIRNLLTKNSKEWRITEESGWNLRKRLLISQNRNFGDRRLFPFLCQTGFSCGKILWQELNRSSQSYFRESLN